MSQLLDKPRAGIFILCRLDKSLKVFNSGVIRSMVYRRKMDW